MKTLYFKSLTFVLCCTALTMLSLVSQAITLAVVGPTTVCPNGTYTYSVVGAPFTANQIRWRVAYNGSPVVALNGTSSSSNFTVVFNSLSPGTAQIWVEAWNTNYPDFANPIDSSPVALQVNMVLRVPAPPNNGVVTFCGTNEAVTVSSSPFLSNVNSDCYFHYPYEWDAPNGWNWSAGYTSVNNSYNPSKVAYFSETNTLTSPSSVNNGYSGTVTITALWNNSYWPAYGGGFTQNTSNNGYIWVGTPSVSNPQVNGAPYSGSTVYTANGVAYLYVQRAGGGTTNWYVANGNGTLYPSDNYCTVNFSNFARVIVESSNRCGSGGSWTFYLSDDPGYSGYKVAPNPTKDNVSLLLDYKEMAGELIQSVELYNDKSKLCGSVGSDQLKVGKYDKNTIDLDAKDLPRGTYFVHVKMKDKVEKHQIVLE